MRRLLSFNDDTEILAVIITVFKSEEVLDRRVAIGILLVVAFPGTVLLVLSTANLVLDARRALAREGRMLRIVIHVHFFDLLYVLNRVEIFLFYLGICLDLIR